MSNEYMRMWFKERGAYEKEIYIKKDTQAEESKIKRRYVQRYMTRKPPEKKLPIIKLKRFQNVGGKTEHKRQDSVHNQDTC